MIHGGAVRYLKRRGFDGKKTESNRMVFSDYSIPDDICFQFLSHDRGADYFF